MYVCRYVAIYTFGLGFLTVDQILASDAVG